MILNRTALVAALMFTALLLTACQTAPPNRGTSGRRMDPTSDSPAELGVRAPRSADLINATDRMAQSIAQRIDIVNPSNPPRIFVGQIENKTSTMRHQNYQVFLVRLRSLLQDSGTRHGVEFVRERTFVEEQRAREYGTKDAASTAAAYQSRADYVLTCEIFDLPAGGTNYYLMSFQLVQLRDAATGPDIDSGAIIWEGMYEVKFQ